MRMPMKLSLGVVSPLLFLIGCSSSPFESSFADLAERDFDTLDVKSWPKYFGSWPYGRVQAHSVHQLPSVQEVWEECMTTWLIKGLNDPKCEGHSKDMPDLDYPRDSECGKYKQGKASNRLNHDKETPQLHLIRHGPPEKAQHNRWNCPDPAHCP